MPGDLRLGLLWHGNVFGRFRCHLVAPGYAQALGAYPACRTCHNSLNGCSQDKYTRHRALKEPKTTAQLSAAAPGPDHKVRLRRKRTP
eukprot:1455257-Amphidinium_carterae.2